MERAKHGYWTQVGVIPRWQLVMVYVVIVAAGATGLLKTSNAAHRADHAAREAKAATRAIQHSRIVATREACAQQNARNRKAVLFLRQLPRGTSNQTPRERDRLLHSFTDALVGPLQDCDALIQKRFG